MRLLAIVVLLALLAWFGATLVRVENQRYAMVTGLCVVDPVKPITPCLERTQTRTGWWWHLYYALIPG